MGIKLYYDIPGFVGNNLRLIPTNHGRFALNPKYHRFKENMAKTWRLLAGDIEDNSKYNIVSIRFYSNHDIDSLIKPILDSLQIAGIIKNDKQIKKVEIIKMPLYNDNKKCYIEVDVDFSKDYLQSDKKML